MFGSDPNKEHSDNDGLNDYVEYWLDTNPHDDDTDKDGYLDGEDLAFGDPLRWNDGGAARTDLRRRAREQFDAEGSDKDGDWLRDQVEATEGTKSNDLDSDNDGVSDGVEAQLRRSGVETHQDSTPDDTTDLDAAREKLGERRWESDRMPDSSSAVESESYDPYAAAGDAGHAEPLLTEPSFDAAAAYEDSSDEQPAYAESMVADAPVDDAGAGDGWA